MSMSKQARSATLEGLFVQAVETLQQLMATCEDPAIKFRAAQCVFTHLIDGVDPAQLGRQPSGERVSWEEFIRSANRMKPNGHPKGN